MSYGPVQLATYLGLEPWQFSRAREAGLIGGPDRARGRWSQQAAAAALERIGEIVLAVGAIPTWAPPGQRRSSRPGSA